VEIFFNLWTGLLVRTSRVRIEIQTNSNALSEEHRKTAALDTRHNGDEEHSAEN